MNLTDAIFCLEYLLNIEQVSAKAVRSYIKTSTKSDKQVLVYTHAHLVDLCIVPSNDPNKHVIRRKYIGPEFTYTFVHISMENFVFMGSQGTL